jgi:hypothetical protein
MFFLIKKIIFIYEFKNLKILVFMSNTVRAGNTARGWNDPPEFLHTAEANNTQNKKTILNKRVSHTLDGIVAVDENDKQSKTLSEPPKIPISNNQTSKSSYFIL